MIVNEMIRGKDVNEVFEKWYELLSNMNEVHESRVGNVVGEVINAISVIEDPTRCVLTSDKRKMSIRYALGEMLWYISAKNTCKGIDKFSGFWKKIADEKGCVNSNYGWCIKEKYGFNQLEYVLRILKESPESRQAVIHIKEPRNTFENPTDDLNCTVCLQFFIRDGKLYMTTYMRSNDLWLGFPYDVFNFTALQIYIAMQLDVDLGTYTHISGSLHLYEKDKKEK